MTYTEESKVVKEFLGWLKEQSIVLCTQDKEWSTYNEYVPITTRNTTLLRRFFD